jgi:hypothetical protein
MKQPRTAPVPHAKPKPAQSGYRVDPDAVAEALLRRLLAGRALERPRTH